MNSLPSDPDQLIPAVAEKLSALPGVESVVLGGSRARGTHSPTSDIDLGIYYDPSRPFDVVALGEIAREIDDQRRAGLVTGFGGWGPWINGGGWLVVSGLHVDFLYRDLDQVSAVIGDCLAGRVQTFYQPGHPLGFSTHIYLGEVAVCQILSDPHGTLASLKRKVIPYPPALRKAVISSFFWEVDFALGGAEKAAEIGDAAYLAGCCFRAAGCLMQTLFALNGAYWLNEKRAVAMAERFDLRPAALQKRVAAAFQGLGGDRETQREAVQALRKLERETAGLLDNLSGL